jgi:hypothetical protein
MELFEIRGVLKKCLMWRLKFVLIVLYYYNNQITDKMDETCSKNGRKKMCKISVGKPEEVYMGGLY